MELVPFKPAAGAALVESGGGYGAGSIPAMVAAQQEMLHAQVDHLHRLVVAQCSLTGINPLAQEMAAGALSIKIGKKPRDLLTPKAVKLMQSLFAVKDTIGKRETREISTLCGVTVTQVREFFASQRTRVRKAVRLSREKALKIEASKAADNVCSISTEQTPLDIEAHAQVIKPLRTLEPVEMPQSSSQLVQVPHNSLQQAEIFQNSLKQAEIQQICATAFTSTGTMQPIDSKINQDSVQKETKQEEVAPGVESEDKKFLESIFALMRKEQTFSGQAKLMEWILQINNETVLSWFLTMGGLTIMSTWLNQAATEEQTTVILIIFKALLHLPLHKALPAHMSAALQTINRLRFYRTQDISSRARNLLSRVSKVLIRSQALKKPQKDLICKQRINEILRDESWRSDVDITETLALTEGASESRKFEPRKTPLLLTASTDESNKKSSLLTKSKERRQVLLVEHPNKKASGKNVTSARSISTNNSRPLSADDIQKAKMRAMFMQEKYGKVDTSKMTDKPEIMDIKKTPVLVNLDVPHIPSSPLTSGTKQNVDPSTSISKQNTVPLPDKPEIPVSSKLSVTTQQNSIEKLDSKRVPWRIPPEVWIDPSWSVSAGENSKELDVQTQRNRREKETFYASLNDIPGNPKDPWDLEMDFDDSLTPEIPVDQPPDADTMEADSNVADTPNPGGPVEAEQFGSTSSPAVAAVANGAAGEPDLELLAVLLKNPQLVFALSSNQDGTLQNEQTVALLDMLKQTGLGLSELVNSLSNGAGVPKESEPGPETVPTSLPSPTPPKDLPASASWRSDFPTQVRTPNLQPVHLSSRGSAPHISSTVQQSFSSVVRSSPLQPYTSVSALPAYAQSSSPSLPQLSVSVNPRTEHVVAVNNLLSRAPVHQHSQSPALASDRAAVDMHQQPALNKPVNEYHNISNPALSHSLMPEPNASYTTLPWQSGAANVTAAAGRNSTPDTWVARATNSFSDALSNPVPYLSQSSYSNQSSQGSYNAYGSGLVSSHGLNRGGFTHTTAEYQTSGRDARQRHSRSPEPVAGTAFGGTQGYITDPLRQRDYGEQSYNPEPSRSWNPAQQSYAVAEPSRQWSSSGQQSYAAAEPSRQWSSMQQSYTPPDHPRQLSSGQLSYTPAEPSSSSSRQVNSVYPGRNPGASRQWSLGNQDHYSPSDGRGSYDRHRRRR